MEFYRTKIVVVLIFMSIVFFPFLVKAQTLTTGPYQVGTGEYRFPAQVYSDILTDRKTEIWARVFWPKEVTTQQIPDNLPLVAILHGNHGTCGKGKNPRLDYGSSYTDTGACLKDEVVTPNHEGYNYIAQQLASYGYIVFSINANRGITSGLGVSGDGGLNLARGKLILKHLELWNQWSTAGGAPTSLNGDENIFLKKVDLSHVGLMGHSRGGEGVRAAYTLYNETGSAWVTKIPQMKVDAIFEIGAVDGQTSRTLDAQDTAWNQLIPVCDGDVSNFEGIQPFNRMMYSAGATGSGQKSVYMVYGANHNFFNTEWQDNDSYGCTNHNPLWGKSDWQSVKQQDIAKKIIVDFFRANLGTGVFKNLNLTFNPLNSVEALISSITQIDRDFSINPNTNTQMRFDDFISTASNVTRTGSKSLTFATEIGDLALKSQLNINWDKSKNPEAPVLNLSRNTPVDISAMKTLDFRFSLPGKAVLTKPLNFSIQLVDQKGNASPAVSLLNYVSETFNPFYDALFQTVRIPISRFSGIDLVQLKTIQFNFSVPDKAQIFLANVRFSNKESDVVASIGPQSKPSIQKMVAQEQTPPRLFLSELNKIEKVGIVTHGLAFPQIAITFSSPYRFKIRNSLPVLEIAGKKFDISTIKNEDGKSRITFLISKEDFSSIRNLKASFKVYYRGNQNESWVFNNTLSNISFE